MSSDWYTPDKGGHSTYPHTWETVGGPKWGCAWRKCGKCGEKAYPPGDNLHSAGKWNGACPTARQEYERKRCVRCNNVRDEVAWHAKRLCSTCAKYYCLAYIPHNDYCMKSPIGGTGKAAQYCSTHFNEFCTEKSCYQKKLSGKDRCQNHAECGKEGCPKYRVNGSSVCVDHKCGEANCVREKQVNFCSEHGCAFGGCGNKKLGNGCDLCSSHKCAISGCMKVRVANSSTCEIHHCVSEGCTNSRVKDREMCMECLKTDFGSVVAIDTKVYTIEFDEDNDDHKIGVGASAKVFLGVVKELNLKVAVKVFTLASNHSGEQFVKNKKSFEREIGILKSVQDCQSVVEVYGYYQISPHKVAIVMEYMPLGSICNLVAMELDDEQKKRILRDMFTSVAEIHKRNIIHRDIKPNNFLVTKKNGEFVVKLSDFGISKIRGMTTTATNSKKGTHRYFAPELFSRSKNLPYSFSSDIFSLGLTLYFVVTGKFPFDEIDDCVMATVQLAMGNVPDIGKVCDVFIALYKGCVDKDPKKRKPASELLSILKYRHA